MDRAEDPGSPCRVFFIIFMCKQSSDKFLGSGCVPYNWTVFPLPIFNRAGDRVIAYVRAAAVSGANGIVQHAVMQVEPSAFVGGKAEQPCLVNAEAAGEIVHRPMERVEKPVGIAGAVFEGDVPVRGGGDDRRRPPVGPLAAIGVAGRHARFVGIVAGLEEVQSCRVDAAGFEQIARRNPVVGQSVGQEQPIGRRLGIGQRSQPGIGRWISARVVSPSA